MMLVAIVHLGLNVSSSAHNCGCVVDGGNAMVAIWLLLLLLLLLLCNLKLVGRVFCLQMRAKALVNLHTAQDFVE